MHTYMPASTWCPRDSRRVSGTISRALWVLFMAAVMLAVLSPDVAAQGHHDLRWVPPVLRKTTWKPTARADGNDKDKSCVLRKAEDTTFVVGDTLCFDVLFVNAGPDTLPAQTVVCEIYVDGVLLKQYKCRHLALAPGSMAGLFVMPGKWDLVLARDGIYTYEMRVDVTDVVQETDEMNNVFSGRIVVHPAGP